MVDFHHRLTVINMNATPVPIGQIHSDIIISSPIDTTCPASLTSLIRFNVCQDPSEEYKSDFRKFVQKRPLHVIIFLTVSVLPNIFLTRLVKCL